MKPPLEELEFLSRTSNLRFELENWSDDSLQVFNTSDYIGYDFEQLLKYSDKSIKIEYSIERTDSPNSWRIGVFRRENKSDSFSAQFRGSGGNPNDYDTYIETDDGAFGISIHETDIKSERVFIDYSRYLTNDWLAGVSVAVGEFGPIDEIRIALHTKKLWKLTDSTWIDLEANIERIDRDFTNDGVDWVGFLKATYYPNAKTGLSLSVEEGELDGSKHYGIDVQRFLSDSWFVSFKTKKTRIDYDFGEPTWEQTSTKLGLGLRF